ncbi:CRISPR-associated endoribonuclease Cas6 [Thermocrinis sp.]
MRFRVKLVRASNEEVPINLDYRRRFISLLKRIFGEEFNEDAPKPYTFAVYMGKSSEIRGGFIWGVQTINFRFSTGDPSVAMSFYNGVVSLKKSGYLHDMNPRLEGALFSIESISKEKEYEPKGSFKTLSPAIVERFRSTKVKDPEERYATPKDSDFKECLLENIQRRYEFLFGKTLSLNRFEFEAIGIKEEIIKHYGGYLRGFLGSFRIHTDSQELLRFIYHYGLGIRNGQGFGYLEVLI